MLAITQLPQDALIVLLVSTILMVLVIKIVRLATTIICSLLNAVKELVWLVVKIVALAMVLMLHSAQDVVTIHIYQEINVCKIVPSHIIKE